MLLVRNENDENRFETYTEAAKFLGTTSGIVRQKFSEFPISKVNELQFPLFIDENPFETFQEARDAFQLSAKELDEIIMGSKEFIFQGVNHKITFPKSIAMVYDLNSTLGDKYSLYAGLVNAMEESEINFDYDDLIDEYYERGC